MKPHMPSLPLPFFAKVQAKQGLLHAVLQQTLSAQAPDMQSMFSPHGDPSTPFVGIPLELDAELELPAPPMPPLVLDTELVDTAPPVPAPLVLDTELVDTAPPVPVPAPLVLDTELVDTAPPVPAPLVLATVLVDPEPTVPEPPVPTPLVLATVPVGSEPPRPVGMSASMVSPASAIGPNPPMFISRLPGAPSREGSSLPPVEEHAATSTAAAAKNPTLPIHALCIFAPPVVRGRPRCRTASYRNSRIEGAPAVRESALQRSLIGQVSQIAMNQLNDDAAHAPAPQAGETTQNTGVLSENSAVAAPRASHDTPPPKALLDFMVKDWAKGPTAPIEPIQDQATFAQRRRALSQIFAGEMLVIPTGHEKVRSNDTHYRFRPATDFYYLTGCVEPDCVLVMIPEADGGHRDVLFVEPNPGRADATFFTDRIKGELWVGPRLGVPESLVRFGVHECKSLPDFKALLDELAGDPQKPRCVLRGFSPKVDGALPESDRDKALATSLSEMRLLKDETEIRELRAVIDSTKRGFEDVIQSLRKATSEREVEGVFNLRARVEGNDVGYGTIAAAGPHACVLHWTRNDGTLHKGELLLLDAGVEGNSLYTADITRTLPIKGRFSKEQRTIYKLVYRAQKAALKQVKPGNDFMEPNRAAMKVLAEGLESLGILKTTAAEALKEEHQFYKRYSLHNVSHMLGLDVHDCAQARQEVYKFGKLHQGMVLTVEPGLYFQENDLTVPEEYRGIGVRIEDDVVVTATGYENLSAHIPSQVDDVEEWMEQIWKSKKKK